MATDDVLLTVYIPSFGRPSLCLNQVRAVKEASLLTSSIKVQIVVSVNGDSDYDDDQLYAAGADLVVRRALNLGANANIALGFEHLANGSYLWILSDDEIITPTAISHLSPLLREGFDLVSASWESAPLVQTVSTLSELDQSGAFYGLVSANVFKGSSFRPNVTHAFDGVLTSYPHAYLIARTMATKGLVLATVPMAQIFDHHLSLAAVTGMNRREAGLAQGTAFFGGGILVAASGRRGGRELFQSWWRDHWHRASMYRLSGSVQARLVDGMARGSLGSLPWYLLSLIPWWRLKERIRPRHSL